MSPQDCKSASQCDALFEPNDALLLDNKVCIVYQLRSTIKKLQLLTSPKIFGLDLSLQTSFHLRVFGGLLCVCARECVRVFVTELSLPQPWLMDAGGCAPSAL